MKWLVVPLLALGLACRSGNGDSARVDELEDRLDGLEERLD
jgi:hypothetical protein